MAELKLDLVHGAGLLVEGQQSRLTRGGMVKGLDLTSTPDPEALLKVLALPGMPAMAQPLNGNYPNIVFTRLRVNPIDKNNVYLQLDFENPQGFTPTVYIVRDASHLTTRRESILPDGTQITGQWIGGGNTIGPITAQFNFLRPVRTLGITALRYGRPSVTAGDFVGYVNDAPWPTDGSSVIKAAGFWLMSGYQSNYYPQQGYYIVEAQASSRIVVDWSEADALIDPQTGRYFEMDDGDLSTIMGEPYAQYEVKTGNGFVRVCGYPVVNFFSLFGF